jgi:iron complex outermembrane receptor protein
VDGNDRARNSVAHGFAGWSIGARTTITGRLLAGDSFAQLNDTPYESGVLPADATVQAIPFVTFTPAVDEPDSRRSARYLSSLAALTHTATPDLSLRIAWQHLGTGRDTRDGPGGTRFEPAFNDLNRFDGRIDTVQVRVDAVPSRLHRLTGGYEFEREHFDNISRDENPSPAERVDARLRIGQSSHSVFVQDQVRLARERLLVSVSGRMQAFSLQHPTFSGSQAPYSGAELPAPPPAWTGDIAAAYFMPASGTKLRAHVGNSYRAPALFERFGASFFFGSFSAFGDPRLGPERVVAMDAGVDQYAAGGRLRASATAFYTRLQEVIAFDFSGLITPATDPYGRFGGYRNTGGGLARGIELSVEAAPSRTTTLVTGYTYTNADERLSVFTSGLLRSVRIPDHMVTVAAVQRIGRRFDLAFDMFAATDAIYGFGNRAFEFDGPVKADLAGGYTVPLGDKAQIRLFTRIENILNRTYYEEGFPTPRAWAVAGVKLLF